MSYLEDSLAGQILIYGLPSPQREYRFAPPRRYRFDFAWPQFKLAVEIEGGTWVNGAHVRGKHFESDCEKYNLAALGGWRVLRFTAHMVRRREAIRVIAEALHS